MTEYSMTRRVDLNNPFLTILTELKVALNGQALSVWVENSMPTPHPTHASAATRLDLRRFCDRFEVRV